MERLRELRGADTRERDLANILGFEHSRAVRWKEGQMYVDRAEYLVRLADALEVDTMLLVNLASGNLSVEQAQRQLQRAGRGAAVDDIKRRKGAVARMATQTAAPITGKWSSTAGKYRLAATFAAMAASRITATIATRVQSTRCSIVASLMIGE